MQLCGLISAWKTKLSVFWCFGLTKIYIWHVLWFLLNKKNGLICTFAFAPFFFYKGHSDYYLSFLFPLFFFLVCSIWKQIKCHPLCSSIKLSCVHLFSLIHLHSSFWTHTHTHTPSLSCLAPVRQLTTQPLNEGSKNGPLKSLWDLYRDIHLAQKGSFPQLVVSH